MDIYEWCCISKHKTQWQQKTNRVQRILWCFYFSSSLCHFEYDVWCNYLNNISILSVYEIYEYHIHVQKKSDKMELIGKNKSNLCASYLCWVFFCVLFAVFLCTPQILLVTLFHIDRRGTLTYPRKWKQTNNKSN